MLKKKKKMLQTPLLQSHRLIRQGVSDRNSSRSPPPHPLLLRSADSLSTAKNPSFLLL